MIANFCKREFQSFNRRLHYKPIILQKRKRKGKRFAKIGWPRESCMKRLEEKVTYFRPSPPADLQWPGVLFSAGTSVCTTQVYVYAGSGMMRVSRGFISLRPMQLQPCDSSHLLLAGAGPVISFYLKGFLLMFKSSPCLWKSLSFEKLGALPECPPFPARPVGGASLLRKPGQQAPTAAVPVLAYMSGKSSARRIPGRVPQSSKACSCFREGLTFLTWQSQRVRSSELERLTVRAGEAMTTRLTDFTDKEVDAGIFFFFKAAFWGHLKRALICHYALSFRTS